MKKNTILIVDDIETNREILCEIFKQDYRVIQASNGKEALDFIQKEKEQIAIILLDIIMPVVDGFGVLEYLNEKGMIKRIPVILITGDKSEKMEEKGYEMGVSDIMSKPFNTTIIKRRVTNVIDLYRHKNHLENLVEKQTRKIVETNDQIIDTLSTIVEFRDLESGEHIKRIKNFTQVLGNYVVEFYKEYNLNNHKLDLIVKASSMHDIGKIAIPDNILLKPGRLTEDEFEIMKTHTVKGCDILDKFLFIDDKEFLNYCYEICLYHHEKYDGKGYPRKLKGDEIPIAAQIVSLADVYDALVSERVYKAAFKPEQAFEMILNGECGVFSPKLLDCFKMVKNSFECIAKNQ